MSLLNTIKTEQLKARKTKNNKIATYLTTLIGEIEIVGKNDGNRITTDEESLKVIQKFAKGVEENIKLKGNSDIYNTELSLYKSYLPKPLTQEELKDIILEFTIENEISNMSGMKTVMNYLKKHYTGQYNGKDASDIIKNIF